MLNGGRFDFDDGGTYCGGWEDGKAHGHGVCTGPRGQGEYSGAWHYGFEVSGVYTWPSGNSFEGQWQNGKRHGLGVERRGRWAYRGEWTQGYKGRYGVRHSTNSQAKYEGTWANGLQDGYGVEMYADGGTYQGQWLRGMRHGYGIRKSAQYSIAAKYRSRSHAHASLTSLRSDQSEEGNDKDQPKSKSDESRGGFVLRARSEPPSRRRSLSERSVAVKRTILQGLRIKKQRSTGDIDQRVNSSGAGEMHSSLRSSGSTASCASDDSAGTGYASHHDHGSFIGGAEEFVDPSAVETYIGEWKNDKRSGFGVSERTDGLKYEGEWFNNKKYGYGVTTMKDGTKEEGKYKNNVLVTSQRKKNLLFVRTSKLRERIDNAVGSAQRATQIALQKSDIATSRSGTAHERADQADIAAFQAREDGEIARVFAKQLSPEFNQDALKSRLDVVNHVSGPMLYHAGGNEAPNQVAHQQHHFIIPKTSQPPPTSLSSGGVDLYSSVANATKPTSLVGANASFPPQSSATPPMMTPPQEVPPSRIMNTAQNAGAQQLLQLQQMQQQHLQQQHQLHQQQQQQLHQQQQQLGYPQIRPEPSTQFSMQNSQQQQQRQKLANMKQTSVDQVVSRQLNELSEFAESRQKQQHAAHVDFAEQNVANRHKLSPTLSRSPSDTSSRHSINQLLNDFYEQYNNAATASTDMAYEQQRYLRQQRTMDDSGLVSPDSLVRRSTLASARDWKKFQQPVASVDTSSSSPSTSTSAAPNVHQRGAGGQARDDSVQRRLRPPMLKEASRHYEQSVEGGARGSVPDLTELVKTPVQMTREEIARLSSQRRQELQRLNEDNELFRNNPLQYLRYLFHPAVKAWLIRWKLPLLVLLLNICLSVIFCQLLTYSTLDKEDLDGNE